MSIWLNILGLLFDIIGVVGLYYITDGFMSSITYNDIKLLSETLSSDPKSSLYKISEALTNRYESGSESKKNRRKKIFFICVIVGFGFQISSSLYSLTTEKIPSKKNDSNTSKCCSKDNK